MTFSFLPRTLSWLLPVKNEKHFLAIGTRLLLILFFQQLRMKKLHVFYVDTRQHLQ